MWVSTWPHIFSKLLMLSMISILLDSILKSKLQIHVFFLQYPCALHKHWQVLFVSLECLRISLSVKWHVLFFDHTLYFMNVYMWLATVGSTIVSPNQSLHMYLLLPIVNWCILSENMSRQKNCHITYRTMMVRNLNNNVKKCYLIVFGLSSIVTI